MLQYRLKKLLLNLPPQHLLLSQALQYGYISTDLINTHHQLLTCCPNLPSVLHGHAICKRTVYHTNRTTRPSPQLTKAQRTVIPGPVAKASLSALSMNKHTPCNGQSDHCSSHDHRHSNQQPITAQHLRAELHAAGCRRERRAISLHPCA